MDYYNLLNEEMVRREEMRDYGNIPGVNRDVSNPNALNRPYAWTLKVKSSMTRADQVKFML